MTEQFWHKDVSDEDIEQAKSAYREAFKYPSLVSAKLDETNDLIESKWSYTDVSDLTGKKCYIRTSIIQEPFLTSRYVNLQFNGLSFILEIICVQFHEFF